MGAKVKVSLYVVAPPSVFAPSVCTGAVFTTTKTHLPHADPPRLLRLPPFGGHRSQIPRSFSWKPCSIYARSLSRIVFWQPRIDTATQMIKTIIIRQTGKSLITPPSPTPCGFLQLHFFRDFLRGCRFGSKSKPRPAYSACPLCPS